MSANPNVRARAWSTRCWRSTTAKPPLRVSLHGEGAGGGVAHAPGVPGATPLREIHMDELICGDGSTGGWGAAMRMGNAGQEMSASSGGVVRVAAAILRSGSWAWSARQGHPPVETRVEVTGSAVSEETALSCVNAFTYPTGAIGMRLPGPDDCGRSIVHQQGSRPATSRRWDDGAMSGSGSEQFSDCRVAGDAGVGSPAPSVTRHVFCSGRDTQRGDGGERREHRKAPSST